MFSRGRKELYALSDDAAAIADGDRMCPGTGLQLREQMTHVRLDRLLREEEALADLTVHETVSNELEHLDLTHCRLLLKLAQRRDERDHLGVAVRPPCRSRLESATVVHIAVEDFLALCSVHDPDIGLPHTLL